MWWVLPACHVIMYSLVIKYFPQVVWLNAVTLRLSSVLLNTNLWQLMLIVFISQFSFWKVESVCFLCFCWVTMLPVSHRIFFKFPVEQKIFVLSFGNIVFQLKMFETENSWAMYATLYIYMFLLVFLRVSHHQLWPDTYSPLFSFFKDIVGRFELFMDLCPCPGVWWLEFDTVCKYCCWPLH